MHSVGTAAPALEPVAYSLSALRMAMRGSLTPASRPCFWGHAKWIVQVDCSVKLKLLSLLSRRSKVVSRLVVALVYNFSDECFPCVFIQGLPLESFGLQEAQPRGMCIPRAILAQPGALPFPYQVNADPTKTRGLNQP